MSVGQRIRECRRKLKMSQQTLGEKCLKLSPQACIGNYENDTRTPDIATILLIARALRTTPEYLTYGKEE